MTSLAKAIRREFADSVFGPPASAELIAEAQARIGIQIPSILIELYKEFNGFRRPSGALYLLPLLAPEESALVRLTLFYRKEVNVPRVLRQSVVFGLSNFDQTWTMEPDGGRLISWNHRMGLDFQQHDPSLLDLYREDDREYQALPESPL